MIERELDALTRPADPRPRQWPSPRWPRSVFCASRRGRDPWDRLTGWRHWSEADQYAHLILRGERREVRVVSRPTGITEIDLGDTTLCARILSSTDQGARVDFEGRVVNAKALTQTGAVTVFYNGQTLVFELPDHLAEAAQVEEAADRLTAPMPGTVNAVKVSQGDSVTKGDALIVMEAMKMELTLTAPRDGVVAGPPVRPGEQVQEGAVLLILADK